MANAVLMMQSKQDAYRKILQALSGLSPDERVLVMDWVKHSFCLDCGYPAPPDDEDCFCKTGD